MVRLVNGGTAGKVTMPIYRTEDDCDTAWFIEITRREEGLANSASAIFSWDEVKRQAHEQVHLK